MSVAPSSTCACCEHDIIYAVDIVSVIDCVESERVHAIDDTDVEHNTDMGEQIPYTPGTCLATATSRGSSVDSPSACACDPVREDQAKGRVPATAADTTRIPDCQGRAKEMRMIGNIDVWGF